tara:strand:- start:99 stop:395 length:297 start_codon:yes stop_codon:yes gene_type:complete
LKLIAPLLILLAVITEIIESTLNLIQGFSKYQILFPDLIWNFLYFVEIISLFFACCISLYDLITNKKENLYFKLIILVISIAMLISQVNWTIYILGGL